MSSTGRPKPPNAGKGRKKGVPNKATKDARLALEMAFEGIGGVKNLTTWAKEAPAEFYKLWGRLIPQKQELSGPDGDAIRVKQEIIIGGQKIVF